MTIYINGTTGISGVDGSAGTPAVQGTDTNTGVFYPAADTVGVSTGGSERMRVDSSGNVGIGTSSPTGKLHIYNSTSGSPAILNINSVNGGGGTTGIYFRPYQSDTQAASNPAQATIYAIDNNYSADLTFNTKTAGAIGNALVERMRIDSSGNLIMAARSSGAGNTGQFQVGQAVGTIPNAYGVFTSDSASPYPVAAKGLSTNQGLVGFFDSSNTVVGSISKSGSTVAYNTSSDYRLKENVQPMTGALLKIFALKPVTYTWKADGSNGQGFIAHELQAVVPDCVTGEKDAVDADGNPVYQGIDTSFLVATLTAAIQEQQAIIQALTNRITALEAK